MGHALNHGPRRMGLVNTILEAIVNDLHDNEKMLRAIGAEFREHIPLVNTPIDGTGLSEVTVSPVWEVLHQFWDLYSSYTLSLFLMFYGSLDNIVSWGGFVLLIIRLIADGPRAYRTLKDYFNGK